MTIIFKPKIRPWSDALDEIQELVNHEQETGSNISIPYGLQLHDQLWNPEVLRLVLHISAASGESFVSHHGVGKNNEIDVWNLAKEKQTEKENRLQEVPTAIRFLHIIFIPKRWIYVSFCTELVLRVYSAKFCSLSCMSTNSTILCLVYNDVTDEIIAGGAGGLMTWRFPIAQTDPLIPGEIINCSFTFDDWVRTIKIDSVSKQILAVSDETISMLDIRSYKEICFFQKKKDSFFTTCVFYHPASYFITGKAGFLIIEILVLLD